VSRNLLLALILALPVASAGCGESGPPRVPVAPVSGQVLYRGHPAASALVTFVPVDTATSSPVRPQAVTGPDGKFVLGSYSTDDGAPTGEYVVLVVWAGPKQPPKAAPGKEANKEAEVGFDTGGAEEGQMKDFLGGRYRNPKTSPLRVTIEPGASELKPIELK
jgi:hypothetical protein